MRVRTIVFGALLFAGGVPLYPGSLPPVGGHSAVTASRIGAGIASAFVPALLNAQRVTQPPRAIQLARPDSARQADSGRVADSTARVVGAPVVVRGDTVLYVPTRQGAFSPDERAAAISRRILGLARTRVDSVVIVVNESSTDLMAADRIIMTVTDADAAAVGSTRSQLAARYAAVLKSEVTKVSIQSTIQTISVGALWTLLATVVLVVILVVLNRLFPRATARLESWRNTRMPALRIRTFEFLSSSVLTDFALGVLRFIRVLLVVVLLYFYIPLVLSFFPWTRSYSDSLFGYVTTPLLSGARAFLTYLPNLVVIAIILVIARYFIKFMHVAFQAVERGTLVFNGFEREWADPTYKILRFLAIAFTMVVLFPYLPGSSSDAFKGVSLFLGLLLSLGSSSAISNIVAGVVLTYTRAFGMGDRVQIGETTGDVVAKTLLVTRLRTIKNVDVTIPNAMVLATHVKNYTAAAATDGLILHTTVTIGYDVPWETVHGLLVEAALATDGIRAEPAPYVLQTSLDDFYVAYEINGFTDRPAQMARIYSTLHANIQGHFAAANVEIMSPHYSGLRNGNLIAIPHTGDGGPPEAPPFPVHVVGRP